MTAISIVSASAERLQSRNALSLTRQEYSNRHWPIRRRVCSTLWDYESKKSKLRAQPLDRPPNPCYTSPLSDGKNTRFFNALRCCSQFPLGSATACPGWLFHAVQSHPGWPLIARRYAINFRRSVAPPINGQGPLLHQSTSPHRKRASAKQTL
jgi:hypothetical protein